ncbi:sensor histidine kinase [Schauerella aestuarii]|uniref:sensor histidine kinase n=1 Tax=Schauerella aestuarii TaxID=2511204 RepID=UPI00136FCC82|nr:HAMP domain-containing sensor histidine kinase [Achromobacter aestuarii]MYZ44965.1 HAMP domain-containing histidine kinase [Achromobacter aestuarii]
MRRLTVTQRLCAVFALLLLACCGASVWLQMRATAEQEQETVQRLSAGLASHIAESDEFMTADGLNAVALRALFDKLMAVNPSVEVYLLNKAGVIVGHAAPPGSLKRDRVDLGPLQSLANGDPLPILGDDPRSATARKVFSAAPLFRNGQPAGFVYVVLLGETHDLVAANLTSSSVLRVTLWSMALVALLGLAAGLIAFRLITTPLRSLTQAVRAFDAGASAPLKLTHRPAALPDGERDEIVVLRHSYEQMAQRIGEQWSALTQADQQRREIIANISHDLRTPLTSLHGYLETLLLKADTLTPDERRRYLDIALAQSRKVGKLAQTLFELARLESGVVQPEREMFSLAELVQDVLQKFELAAEARRLTLSIDVGRDVPMACADLGMIERVLTNLLDNAIRHTPAGGTIEVALHRAHEAVAVSVSDTGPGIPQSLREGLFKRASSLGPAQGDRGGLGLLIVRRILQLHDSDIRLVERAGKGAVFEFALPVVKAAG